MHQLFLIQDFSILGRPLLAAGAETASDQKSIWLICISAAVAATGYLGKYLLSELLKGARKRRSLLAGLSNLRSLLHASKALYDAQQVQVKVLRKRVATRLKLEPTEGYEDFMVNHYADFQQGERDRHDVIRALTAHGLFRVNEAMLKFLEKDEFFKTQLAWVSRSRELARDLRLLEAHLVSWHAKFETWIPNKPSHALVYLADEEKHGIGFPNERQGRNVDAPGSEVPEKAEGEYAPGVEAEIDKALSELRENWKLWLLAQ